MVGQPLGRAEDAHHAVADELVRLPAMALEDRHDELEEVVQVGDRLARRRALRERREVADVDEHDRHLHVLALEQLALRHHALGDARRDVAPERRPQPLAFLEAREHLVERARELADLVARRDEHARGEVTALHALDGVDQLTHRSHHRAGEQQRELERDRERDEHRDDHVEAEVGHGSALVRREAADDHAGDHVDQRHAPAALRELRRQLQRDLAHHRP